MDIGTGERHYYDATVNVLTATGIFQNQGVVCENKGTSSPYLTYPSTRESSCGECEYVPDTGGSWKSSATQYVSGMCLNLEVFNNNSLRYRYDMRIVDEENADWGVKLVLYFCVNSWDCRQVVEVDEPCTKIKVLGGTEPAVYRCQDFVGEVPNLNSRAVTWENGAPVNHDRWCAELSFQNVPTRWTKDRFNYVCSGTY